MIYNVTLYYRGSATVSVEARDEEKAEECAIEQLYDGGVEDNIEVNDVVVVKSDNQTTDQMELFSREELDDGDRRRSDG